MRIRILSPARNVFFHCERCAGYLPAAVRARGGHLVAGHHAHRDGGRGAALLQRAAAAGHAPDPRHAATQAQEPEGVAPAPGIPLQDAGARPSPGRTNNMLNTGILKNLNILLYKDFIFVIFCTVFFT